LRSNNVVGSSNIAPGLETRDSVRSNEQRQSTAELCMAFA
jgi:hypothetical protein